MSYLCSVLENTTEFLPYFKEGILRAMDVIDVLRLRDTIGGRRLGSVKDVVQYASVFRPMEIDQS